MTQRPDFSRLKADTLHIAKGVVITAAIFMALFWLAVYCNAIP